MSIREKLWIASAVSVILLALRFCVLPLLSGLLSALLPFFAALAVAAAILPVSRRLSTALHLPLGPTSVILTVLALLALAVGGFLLLRATVLELGELLGYLSGADSPLPRIGLRLSEWLRELRLDGLVETDGGSVLLRSLGTLLSGLGGVLGGAIARLPSLVFFLLTVAIAAVYLVLWLPRAGERLPPSLSAWLLRGREVLLSGLGVYARAYAILFCVTALLSLVGLWLLRAPYPLLLALLLALVDLLPVLGVGTVLIPWAAFSFLTGRGAYALCLVLLWAAITAVRRVLEDRLVGRGLGLHPFWILLSVCLGLHFLGFLGLLFGPLAAALVGASLRRSPIAEK